mmetsp:Transcript_76100/g.203404  ORF Transcript_76100/g.203404 Transcript_76100/m.203404 type:complete len:219 (-) Transcript_76100:1919-2575(-)
MGVALAIQPRLDAPRQGCSAGRASRSQLVVQLGVAPQSLRDVRVVVGEVGELLRASQRVQQSLQRPVTQSVLQFKNGSSSRKPALQRLELLDGSQNMASGPDGRLATRGRIGHHEADHTIELDPVGRGHGCEQLLILEHQGALQFQGKREGRTGLGGVRGESPQAIPFAERKLRGRLEFLQSRQQLEHRCPDPTLGRLGEQPQVVFMIDPSGVVACVG